MCDKFMVVTDQSSAAKLNACVGRLDHICRLCFVSENNFTVTCLLRVGLRRIELIRNFKKTPYADY